jgi:hypothetical protein
MHKEAAFGATKAPMAKATAAPNSIFNVVASLLLV